MHTKTVQKRKSEGARNSLKEEESDEKEEQNNKNENEPADEKPKTNKKATTDLRKLLFASIDPNHRLLMWWETEHVRYAINYPPVKSRLEKVMGSHVVRLTDYQYMKKLAANLHEDHLEQQRTRIEGRKLAPPSIIKRLLEISNKSLCEVIRANKRNKIKMYM
nr:PREDICTED: uncharacterized protein LOC105663467 [Megachile rotundata]